MTGFFYVFLPENHYSSYRKKAGIRRLKLPFHRIWSFFGLVETSFESANQTRNEYTCPTSDFQKNL